ncbi:MAG: tRNA (adenosine(37)-N6)-threonylcarbamoyltransferase complex transferase subunit TsaD [Ktedonobacterales bacterium]
MRILGIESSCDETGAAIVDDGRTILSNVVASSASIHARYGGVVPEVASRQQLSAIIPVLETALEQARASWESIDGIAVTYGPGLAGSLLVGLTAGKTLSLASSIPFVGVNHLEAHIYANWLRREGEAPATLLDIPSDDELPSDPAFPLLALVISGAHSELVHIPHHGRYELLGQTRDDAAGEAFDKVARVLGLGYPGGPAIERAASSRDTSAHNPYTLPRAWLPGTYDFSFSGLKTAVAQMVEGATGAASAEGASRYTREGQDAAATGGIVVPEVAAAFQDAVVDVLATKTVRAATALGVRQVVLAGGVAANLALRVRLTGDLAPHGIALRYPPVALCTDNAAMIAAAGYFHLRLGERSGFDLDVRPNLQLPFVSPH